MTLPGRALLAVRRYMPFTKASMTVIRPRTAVKANAVSRVVGQRTIRLRKLYDSGTLPTAARASSRIRPAARGTRMRGETGKDGIMAPGSAARSGELGEDLGDLDAAGRPGGDDAAD